MIHQFSRLELGIGNENFNKLKNSKVLVIGVGGVGSFSAEALARSGVGTIILVDNDTIDITNINRQIHSLISTIGLSKIETMKKRIHDINKECNVITYSLFFNGETKDEILANDIDFVVDACDTISNKILLIKECLNRNIKFISSMGAANKMDPTMFEISDIKKTSYDPLAKVIRQQLKKARINKKVPVIFSKEIPLKQDAEYLKKINDKDSDIRKQKIPPASNSFVPSTVGLIAASYVIRKILGM